jgi:hypothetical protein
MSVAQIFNLLYRRIPFCEAPISEGLGSENRRYSTARQSRNQLREVAGSSAFTFSRPLLYKLGNVPKSRVNAELPAYASPIQSPLQILAKSTILRDTEIEICATSSEIGQHFSRTLVREGRAQTTGLFRAKSANLFNEFRPVRCQD